MSLMESGGPGVVLVVLVVLGGGGGGCGGCHGCWLSGGSALLLARRFLKLSLGPVSTSTPLDSPSSRLFSLFSLSILSILPLSTPPSLSSRILEPRSEHRVLDLMRLFVVVAAIVLMNMTVEKRACSTRVLAVELLSS